MSRRGRNRYSNVSYYEPNNSPSMSDLNFRPTDNFIKQEINPLFAFESLRNDIFKRLDDNHREVKKLILDVKHEMFKKMNDCNKRNNWAQNKLKKDIVKQINCLTSNSGLIVGNDDNGNGWDTPENEDVMIETARNPTRLLDDQNDENTNIRSTDTRSKDVQQNKFFTKKVAQVNEIIKLNKNDGWKAFEFLSGVANKVIRSNTLLVDSTTPNVLNTITPIRSATDVFLENSKNPINNGMGKKTGAIRKVINKDPSRSVQGSNSGNKMEEELELIVQKLAKELNVEYDKENVRAVCRKKCIVIEFHDLTEFEKWRVAARFIVEKEKFSYKELLELEEVDVIFNKEKFECPVCFSECEVGQGVVLRECLHAFCRQCIIQTVEHNTDTVVTCPFASNDYVCSSIIQQREMKEILPKDLYETYLERTVTVVGNRLSNALHCKKPDCRYFLLLDEDETLLVTSFVCELCRSVNCIPCKAVHSGMDCKEYQDELKILAETDPRARETLRMFERMIRNKEALACPKCEIIITKSDGCDAIECLMCRTQICWATLGPRWGPLGHGDTSGGCRCGVNGVRCHPNCKNCH